MSLTENGEVWWLKFKEKGLPITHVLICSIFNRLDDILCLQDIVWDSSVFCRDLFQYLCFQFVILNFKGWYNGSIIFVYGMLTGRFFSVPCHESLAVLELGSWPMLSIACVVKRLVHNEVVHTSPSFSNWSFNTIAQIC